MLVPVVCLRSNVSGISLHSLFSMHLWVCTLSFTLCLLKKGSNSIQVYWNSTKLLGRIRPCGSMRHIPSSIILGMHSTTPRNRRTPTHIHQQNMSVGLWHLPVFVSVTEADPGRSGLPQYLHCSGPVAKQTLNGAMRSPTRIRSILSPIAIRCLI